ncbi:hypothetical protein TNCV_1500831 [Trichonephila clavipes]|nr:hypothetical protein TNCV_1500831 [Trichonephila clavipes]
MKCCSARTSLTVGQSENAKALTRASKSSRCVSGKVCKMSAASARGREAANWQASGLGAPTGLHPPLWRIGSYTPARGLSVICRVKLDGRLGARSLKLKFIP